MHNYTCVIMILLLYITGATSLVFTGLRPTTIAGSAVPTVGVAGHIIVLCAKIFIIFVCNSIDTMLLCKLNWQESQKL